MTLWERQNPAYEGQLWLMITWGLITRSSILSEPITIVGTIFQKRVILHCQWKACIKILTEYIVVLLLWPAICPHGIFSSHKCHQYYIFLVTEQGLLNFDLHCYGIFYSSCPHSKVAAFHVTQYMRDSINSRVKSSTSVTQRGPLGSLHRRTCEMECYVLYFWKDIMKYLRLTNT